MDLNGDATLATVLIVEDEAAICALMAHVLREAGYRVLTATGPEDGRAVAEEYSGDIALIIADVVMPGTSGVELAEQVSRTYPGIKSLFVSGLHPDELSKFGVVDRETQFLPKPFNSRGLSLKVQEILA